MTRNMKLIIAGILSVTALGSAAIAAETMLGRGPMRADTNRDGIVSRGEFFAAAETRFKRRDANGDRKLSGAELTDRRGRFARHDTNNDGTLSFAEAAANTAARFGRLDIDADGKLTPEELRPHHRHGRGDLAQDRGGRMAIGAGILRRLDANSDGKITREEMHVQADQRFDRLNANLDGVIDRAELQAMRGAFMDRRGPGGPDLDGPPPPPPPPADDGQ